LDYIIYRINSNKKWAPYTQKAIEKTPEIPENEHVWYFCPLEPLTVPIQIALGEKWFTLTNLCGCQHETLRPA
jgi:hypothetical protein